MSERSAETTVDPDTGEELEKIVIELPPDHWSGSTGERFWARRLDDTHFVVRNIPWYAYDLDWGDTVRCEGHSPAGLPQIVEVVGDGGHRTLRVMFEGEPAAKADVLAEIEQLGGGYENADGRLYAVDIEPGVAVEPIMDVLARESERGVLAWETGWS